MQVDCFVVLTDSETWSGGIHPTEALRQYRDKMGILARLLVCINVIVHLTCENDQFCLQFWRLASLALQGLCCTAACCLVAGRQQAVRTAGTGTRCHAGC
jgi:hypothetical protein